MNVRLKFYGGAGTVTGSRYLLEVDDRRILIECGLFQGPKELRERNWDPPAFEPDQIYAVILTHAHLDHSGYLPRLVSLGFQNSIHCTHATSDLLEILWLDSAKLQEEEAAYAQKKGYSKHENPQPLYTQGDVHETLPLIKGHQYHEPFFLFEDVKVEFLQAGHILGASMVKITLLGKEQIKTLLFSGDLGREKDPLMFPPEHVAQADILLLESTYGNRNAPHETEALGAFADAISNTFKRGGCVLIPAFSVGRTQNLLYYLKKLMYEGSIPKADIYMDSPMAIAASELYLRHIDIHKITPEALQGDDSFAILRKHLKIVREQKDSVKLNELEKGAIIISASGMMTGGRILHHLYNRLPRKNDTLIITGFQAVATRGRRIVEGEEQVKIFGEMVPVKCHVENLKGFSAHADQSELLQWLAHFESSPKRTFLVHGEPEASRVLQNEIKEKLGWEAIIPQYREAFLLFDSI